LRLADLPALDMRAARDFDMPFCLRARYFRLFLIDLPAMEHFLPKVSMMKLIATSGPTWIHPRSAFRIAALIGRRAAA
jgi:hypothetical protein